MPVCELLQSCQKPSFQPVLKFCSHSTKKNSHLIRTHQHPFIQSVIAWSTTRQNKYTKKETQFKSEYRPPAYVPQSKEVYRKKNLAFASLTERHIQASKNSKQKFIESNGKKSNKIEWGKKIGKQKGNTTQSYLIISKYAQLCDVQECGRRQMWRGNNTASL